MKLERRSLSRLAVPLKALADRFAVASLLGISVALLALGGANMGAVTFLSTRITDVLAPALGLLSEPVLAARRLAESAGELAALREENARLRDRNRRLMEWQDVARQIALENQALRQALGMDPEAARPASVAARVVADGGGPFVHTVLLNVGRDHGVVRGMAAVNERGLVGRVIEVGRRSSRLLLLIDLNARIPVMVESSRDQAILAGDNTRQPKLIFLPLNPRVAVGDRVVTSGRGGLLPAGLKIGVVSEIADDRVAVATWVDWDRLEYVRLLEYVPVAPPEPVDGPEDAIYGPPPPTARPAGEPERELARTPAATASEAPRP